MASALWLEPGLLLEQRKTRIRHTLDGALQRTQFPAWELDLGLEAGRPFLPLHWLALRPSEIACMTLGPSLYEYQALIP